MKVLVFGKTGQLARELAQFDHVTCIGREEVDLRDAPLCAQIILEGDWLAVINAAAYTAVDKAEEEEALAFEVNAVAPEAMAKACAEKNIPFVYVSTDYVFDGSGEEPWKPEDQVAPQNAYGRSKLAGERAVLEAGGVYGILRTSWVFSSHGHNFVKTMLRLGAEKDELAIVGDQIGGPTAARDIAHATMQMQAVLSSSPEKSGIYHFSGQPCTSWAGFAREIFLQAKIDCVVNEIPTSKFPTPAKRPLNSRLSCESLNSEFGIEAPDWRISLSYVLGELGYGA